VIDEKPPASDGLASTVPLVIGPEYRTTTKCRDMNSRVKNLLGSTVVWDNHGCLPLRADDRFLPQLERYRSAGVTVASINVGFAGMPWADHLHVLSYMRRWISLRPDVYCLVANVEDVQRCKRTGLLGIVFDVEGMSPVENDLSLVKTFYELGVRWMLVAYNRNNAAGGGCLDDDSGLTHVGCSVIDEMERVGMVLCLSHTGARTAAEALEYSKKPVIFSHSNPYGDTAHVRNVSDGLMRACADKGGVIGLTGLAPFLGGGDNLVARIVRQLCYAIDLVGAEHVGLGMDYVFDKAEFEEHVRTNPVLFPAGMGHPSEMGMIGPEEVEVIADNLAKQNLSDQQIRGVLGENWLRVARCVWR
jgi:membrane dipeptidase